MKKNYLVTKQVPKSKVSTYVGNALNKNPFTPEVPCYRTVKSDSLIGGFPNRYKKKKAPFKKEGLSIRNNKVISSPPQQSS